MDSFTGNLIKLTAEIYKSGGKPVDQDVRLHLLRNDFLPTDDDSRILQVEINTISAGFAGVLENLSIIHFTHRPLFYPALSGELPPNQPCKGFAEAIAMAVAEHNKKWGTLSTCVLFVIEDGERNIIDQYTMERCLVGQFRLIVIRRTLSQIAKSAYLGDDGQLYVDSLQVALVYFRSGYDPKHYPTQEEWNARRLIEKSLSVKCPSLLSQLAGTKKVQQSWYENHGRLLVERFGFDDSEVANMFKFFARQCAPSEDPAMVEEALLNAENWVLKPQREGGGHNLYGGNLIRVLTSSHRDELSQYVLMERMKPRPLKALIVDIEKSIKARRIVPRIMDQTVSELGIYSFYIPAIQMNEITGHLLRTKPKDIAEGGVNAGFAVLDTLLLM